MRLFEKGREGILGATIDWDNHTIKAALLDLNTADVGVKQISSSTNASPIVVTATSHGFTNGDLVYVADHTTNTCANGIWQIAGVATNTFQLIDPVSGSNSTGNGVGGATGYAVNLGPSASGDNFDDFDGCLVGSAVTLTSPTITNGVADAADVTFTSVSGATVEAIIIYDNNSGVSSTSPVICLITGRHIVTADAQANTSATTIVVEPLAAAIPNGQVLAFSNGASATLSAGANAGDRALTVSALAANITSGSRALATNTAVGLPVTPNGGNINITWDNGTNRIFKL